MKPYFLKITFKYMYYLKLNPEKYYSFGSFKLLKQGTFFNF